jgi:hypothetical protein
MEGREDGGDRPDLDLAGASAAGLGHGGFGTLGTGAEREKVTNEANLDDDVRIPQTREIVEVGADSGVDSGLDTLRTKPKLAGGEREDQISKSVVSGEVIGAAVAELHETAERAVGAVVQPP